MSKEHGVLGLVGICIVVVLFSIAGLASDFITRLLNNVDGLLLFAICAMMGGLFSLMLFLMAKEEGWLPGSKSASGDSPEKGTKRPA